jgi:hypothetical protein
MKKENVLVYCKEHDMSKGRGGEKKENDTASITHITFLGTALSVINPNQFNSRISAIERI